MFGTLVCFHWNDEDRIVSFDHEEIISMEPNYSPSSINPFPLKWNQYRYTVLGLDMILDYVARLHNLCNGIINSYHYGHNEFKTSVRSRKMRRVWRSSRISKGRKIARMLRYEQSQTSGGDGCHVFNFKIGP